MKNLLKKTACAVAVLLTAFGAVMAEESVDLRVIGTISPAGCKLELPSGNTVDYGIIPSESLKQDVDTILEEKQLNFDVRCDAPAKVAIYAYSAKRDTAANTEESVEGYGVYSGKLFNVEKVNVTGLGNTKSGAKIGGYGIRLVPESYLVDGKKATLVRRLQGAGSWLEDPDSGSLLAFAGLPKHLSWAKVGETDPVSFKVAAGQLAVQAYITKASDLDLTQPIEFESLTTLELVYL